MAALLADPRLSPQVTSHRVLPESEAKFAEPARPWPAAVKNILNEQGIASLYSHQAEAVNHLRIGRHTVVATPTASGKSIIYNLPTLERFLADPDSKAIYLFPLKALAQDQLGAFTALTSAWPRGTGPTAAVYDGDTTTHFRAKIRKEPPSVLFTNPEMLHLGILPHHHLWSALFAGLSLVVVDEAHTYRGLFGAHMAQVFRRLLRVAALYGASPAFALCSATLGNPVELARKLTGLEAVPILESGAPQGKRHFIFINPEDSPATCAIRLLRSALKRGMRTIVYCQSRRMTELVSLWASEKSGHAGKISAYRAGYLPEERRQIESKMASGELLAVISTSALELGIDIGGLDLCILVGYPGTVMSTLQRGGRVGRSRRESCVALIAQEDALDQYIVRHADDFFSRPPEKAVLNPDNPVILARHLECAAAELPLCQDRPEDVKWLSGVPGLVAAELERRGELLRSADGRELVAARKRPQRHVDLRGSGMAIAIEDESGQIIGSVDAHRAMRETHPGAVYIHRGRHYEIIDLDLGSGRARARQNRPPWHTRSRSRKSTEILSVEKIRQVCGVSMALGRLRVTEHVTGYEKRALNTSQLLGVVPLDFPPQVFETQGFWFMIPRASQQRLEDALMHFMGAIHALEHAIIGILPLLVMTDRNDLGGISTPMHPQTGAPTIFVYDGMPGGAGLCLAAFHDAETLFARTLDVVKDCKCELGCPSCVHSPKCGSGNRPIDKEGALALLLHMPECRGEPIWSAPEDLGASESAALKMEGESESDHELYSASSAGNSPRHFAEDGPAGDGSCANEQNGGSGYAPAASNAELPLCPGQPNSGQKATRTVSRKTADESLPSSVPGKPTDFVVLDIETRRSAQEAGGWHNPGKMGVSIAVLYDSRDDQFHSYTQDRLKEMLPRLQTAPLVVGFNIIRFDYAVLAPHVQPFDLSKLPTVDMLALIHKQLSYRVSLDNIARATLNSKKSADGLMALRWWKEGRLDLIEQYCRQDVLITRDVFLHGLENGHVLFTNKSGQAVRVRALWARGTVNCV